MRRKPTTSVFAVSYSSSSSCVLCSPSMLPTPPHKMTFVFVCDFVSREFVQTAWEDIERFKEQKNKDLHEALISYAIMQMSMCKKVFSDVCFSFSTACIYSCTLAYFLWSWFFISHSYYCCMSLRITLVLFHSFNVSGNPGVVQRQRVFQQNVSHFPAQSQSLSCTKPIVSEISWFLNCSFKEMAMGAQMLPSCYDQSKLLKMIWFHFLFFSHWAHAHTYTYTHTQNFPSHLVDPFVINPSVWVILFFWHSSNMT